MKYLDGTNDQYETATKKIMVALADYTIFLIKTEMCIIKPSTANAAELAQRTDPIEQQEKELIFLIRHTNRYVCYFIDGIQKKEQLSQLINKENIIEKTEKIKLELINFLKGTDVSKNTELWIQEIITSFNHCLTKI